MKRSRTGWSSSLQAASAVPLDLLAHSVPFDGPARLPLKARDRLAELSEGLHPEGSS